MKILQNLAGAVLTLVGAVWFFQGIGLLPGSFMTGQMRWAVYGGVAAVFGIAILLRTNGAPRV